MKLSIENIEEYILLLADQELDEAEEVEVVAFIEQHAGYKPMLDAYLATKLDPAESFVFPDKESLLKSGPVALPFQKKNTKPLRWAAAASILIGVSVAGALLFSNKEIKDSGHNSIASKDTIRKALPTIINNVSPDSILLAKETKTTTASKTIPVQVSKAIVPVQTHFAAITPELPTKKETVPAKLDDVDVTKVRVYANVTADAIAMAEQEPGISDEHTGKPLPAWLPVNDENLQGVNDLVAHIQLLKERIQEKAQSLKKTAIVFNIGDREISIGKLSTQ
jgi:hypothetical protein